MRIILSLFFSFCLSHSIFSQQKSIEEATKEAYGYLFEATQKYPVQNIKTNYTIVHPNGTKEEISEINPNLENHLSFCLRSMRVRPINQYTPMASSNLAKFYYLMNKADSVAAYRDSTIVYIKNLGGIDSLLLMPDNDLKLVRMLFKLGDDEAALKEAKKLWAYPLTEENIKYLWPLQEEVYSTCLDSIKFQDKNRGTVVEAFSKTIIENHKKYPKLNYAFLTHIRITSVFYEIGAELFEKKKHSEALAYFNHPKYGLAKEDEYASRVADRADCYHQLKEYAKALVDYTFCISKYPKRYEYYWSRALVYRDMEDYAKAIPDYDKAIEFRSNYDRMYTARGYAKLKISDFAGAVADYTKAIELNPKSEAAYSQRGAARTFLKQFDAAIADYESALAIDPNSSAAKYNLSVLKKKLGKQ